MAGLRVSGGFAGEEEGVEEAEECALVGGGEVLDLPEAAEEASGSGVVVLVQGLEAEELVGGDAECLGESGDEPGGRLGIGCIFVVSDHALGGAGGLAELVLGEAAAPAERGEPVAESLESGSCHGSPVLEKPHVNASEV